MDTKRTYRKKLEAGLAALLCSLALPVGAQQVVSVPMAPRINTIYASPMMRTNEIPLYGKNKSTYFYNAPKEDRGIFGDAGLYAFASYAQGPTTGGGVNLDNPYAPYGSEANDTMGDATSFGVGVGRILNSNMYLELAYTSTSGMRYGNYARFFGEADGGGLDDECLDEDGNDICGEELAATLSGRSNGQAVPGSAGGGAGSRGRSSSTSLARASSPVGLAVAFDGDEVLGGGAIRSDFFSVGMQYRLDRTFGSIMGGMIKPYVAGHVGMAINTIDDYTLLSPGWVDDGDIYEIDDEGAANGYIWQGDCVDSWCDVFEYGDANVLFKGATTKNFGYALEAGLTLAIEKNFQIEFFYKWSNYGRVATSGNAIVDQYVDPVGILNMEKEVTDATTCFDAAGGSGNCFGVDPNSYLANDNLDGFLNAALSQACITAGGSNLTLLPGGDDLASEPPQAQCIQYGQTFRDVEVLNRNTESGELSFRQFGVKLKYLF